VKERARQYLDIAGVAFVALDNEGNIALINRRGLEILGYQQQSFLEKTGLDPVCRIGFRKMF